MGYGRWLDRWNKWMNQIKNNNLDIQYLFKNISLTYNL